MVADEILQPAAAFVKLRRDFLHACDLQQHVRMTGHVERAKAGEVLTAKLALNFSDARRFRLSALRIFLVGHHGGDRTFDLASAEITKVETDRAMRSVARHVAPAASRDGSKCG
jgi:hypothetical protein